MAVKIGFFVALVALTVCLMATQSAAAPPAQTPMSVRESQSQLAEESAGRIELSPVELESTRFRRSPKVCRRIIVHNKKNGLNYPHWECN